MYHVVDMQTKILNFLEITSQKKFKYKKYFVVEVLYDLFHVLETGVLCIKCSGEISRMRMLANDGVSGMFAVAAAQFDGWSRVRDPDPGKIQKPVRPGEDPQRGILGDEKSPCHGQLQVNRD